MRPSDAADLLLACPVSGATAAVSAISGGSLRATSVLIQTHRRGPALNPSRARTIEIVVK